MRATERALRRSGTSMVTRVKSPSRSTRTRARDALVTVVDAVASRVPDAIAPGYRALRVNGDGCRSAAGGYRLPSAAHRRSPLTDPTRPAFTHPRAGYGPHGVRENREEAPYA